MECTGTGVGKDELRLGFEVAPHDDHLRLRMCWDQLLDWTHGEPLRGQLLGAWHVECMAMGDQDLLCLGFEVAPHDPHFGLQQADVLTLRVGGP